MEPRHVLNDIKKQESVMIQFASELKGDGYGFGPNTNDQVFYVYNYPYFYYYDITDFNHIIDVKSVDGVNYLGLDAIEVARRVFNNDLYIYRALKSSRVHTNFLDFKQGLLNFYFRRDNPIELGKNMDENFKLLEENNPVKNIVTYYDYLTFIHIHLYQKILVEIKKFPYTDLWNTFIFYCKHFKKFQKYKPHLSRLINQCKGTPNAIYNPVDIDTEFIQYLEIAQQRISRRVPKNVNMSMGLNEFIEQILRV